MEGSRVIPRSAGGEGDPFPITLSPSSHLRQLRLIGMGAALVGVLGGCASSPEAARERGEPGADPGNHGNPVVLLAPADRVDRVYYEIPFDEQGVSEDTSES